MRLVPGGGLGDCGERLALARHSLSKVLEQIEGALGEPGTLEVSAKPAKSFCRKSG